MTKPLYKPVLLIGAGGTGVKVLRFIQSIANEGIDHELAGLMKRGDLRMVALDTDAKSNARVSELDPGMIGDGGKDGFSPEQIPKRLHLINKTWIHLDRTSLNEAVTSLHHGPTQLDLDGPDVTPLRTIAKWFPGKRPNGDQITLGHSKLSGAAQWRPLGRMSLFLDAPRIYKSLQNAVMGVKQVKADKDAIDAYIICSLAGGTGSGLFWDLSFFLQMIAPNTRTTGMFLLGDPFESVDEGGRIFPNIYGALKEIHYFKNWIRDVSVEYPIGAGKVFDSTKTGLLPFDTVYLFQSFPPAAGVVDRARSTIDLTCYRMAQNLLSHLRRDVHGVLDVGANNMDSDATSMASEPKKSYCFSTSSSLAFHMHDVAGLAPWFKRELLEPHLKNLPRPLEPTDDISIIAELLRQPATFKDFKAWFNKNKQHSLSHLAGWKERVEQTRALLEKNDTDDPADLVRTGLGPRLSQALEKGGADGEMTLEGAWFEYGKVANTAVTDFFNDLRDHLPQPGLELLFSTKILSRLQEWGEQLKRVDQGEDKVSYDLVFHFPEPLKNYRELNRVGRGDLRGVSARLVKSKSLRMAEKKIYLGLLNDLIESFSNHTVVDGDIVRDVLLARAWNDESKTFKSELDHLIQTEREKSGRNDKREHYLLAAHHLYHNYLSDKPHKVVGQLELFLSQMIANDGHRQGRSAWFEEQSEKLIQALAKAFGLAVDNHRNLRIEELNTDRVHMQKLLKDLNQGLLETSNHRTLPLRKEPFLEFLNEFLPAPRYEMETDVNDFLNRIDTLVDTVTGYWTNCLNNIMMQSGGPENFRDHLYRCKPRIFANGRRENPINKKHLVIFPFVRDMAESEKENLKEQFTNISQEVFKLDPAVDSNITRTPIIYYEDLFREASEIRKIHDYFHAYAVDNATRKAFFHVLPTAADLDEIVQRRSNSQVHCGNPGCDANLRGKHRRNNLCDGCGGPIWNRCGNPDCTEDQLIKRIRTMENGGTNCKRTKAYVPHQCPSCGGKLKNWWWECPEHRQPNPADKISCVTCLEEFHAGKRTKIHKRKDHGHLFCAGCENWPGHCCPVKVPVELIPFYQRGVNGHDSIQFAELIHMLKSKGHTIDAHVCPKGKKRHFLFPTCPIGAEHEETIHHLYKTDEGDWRCTQHPEMTFFHCGHCEYPVHKDQDGECPRCLYKVRSCYYCTEHTKVLQYPIDGSQPDRCRYCMNLMDNHSQEFLFPDVEDSLEFPSFCPNIFDCKAATHPWHTASEYRLNHCHVCSTSSLIPREHLNAIVEECPLCLILLSPVPNGIDRQCYSLVSVFEKLFSTYKGPLSDEQIPNYSAMPSQKACLICGCHKLKFFTWVFRTLSEKGDSTEKDAFNKVISTGGAIKNQEALKELTDKAGKSPKLDLKMVIDILRALVEERDDLQAYRRLKKQTIMTLPHLNPELLTQLMPLFPEGSFALRMIRKRLMGLLHQQQLITDKIRSATKNKKGNGHSRSNHEEPPSGSTFSNQGNGTHGDSGQAS